MVIKSHATYQIQHIFFLIKIYIHFSSEGVQLGNVIFFTLISLRFAFNLSHEETFSRIYSQVATQFWTLVLSNTGETMSVVNQCQHFSNDINSLLIQFQIIYSGRKRNFLRIYSLSDTNCLIYDFG